MAEEERCIKPNREPDLSLPETTKTRSVSIWEEDNGRCVFSIDSTGYVGRLIKRDGVEFRDVESYLQNRLSIEKNDHIIQMILTYLAEREFIR